MQHHIPKILLVDDDKELCNLLSAYLEREGMDTQCVYNGEDALNYLGHGLKSDNTFNTTGICDALVLDIMMPGMSGLELLQKLRPESDLPVIMLTGRGDDIDRIVGLEMGADDYLSKPCNPRELLARLRAVLRRVQRDNEPVENTSNDDAKKRLCLQGITLDPGARRTNINGIPLRLTSAEFNTLHQLMLAAGQPISKKELTEKVLHRKLQAYDRSIDVHISRVRQKLSAHGIDGIIKSLRGQGYQLLTEPLKNA